MSTNPPIIAVEVNGETYTADPGTRATVVWRAGDAEPFCTILHVPGVTRADITPAAVIIAVTCHSNGFVAGLSAGARNARRAMRNALGLGNGEGDA